METEHLFPCYQVVFFFLTTSPRKGMETEHLFPCYQVVFFFLTTSPRKGMGATVSHHLLLNLAYGINTPAQNI